MNKNKIIFPKENLIEAFNKERKHIVGLLSDSKILFENKRFSTSISLSILALEEIRKLMMIREHIIKQEDVYRDEWAVYIKGGSHEHKLSDVYLQPLQHLQKITDEEYKRFIENDKKLGNKQKFSDLDRIKQPSQLMIIRLKKLNEIKKACWYLSEHNTKPYTLNTVCESKYLSYLGKWIFDLVVTLFNDEVLTYKYPPKIFHEIPKEVNILVQDKAWQQIQRYVVDIETFDYKVVIHTASAIIDLFPEEYTLDNVKKLIKSKQTKDI